MEGLLHNAKSGYGLSHLARFLVVSSNSDGFEGMSKDFIKIGILNYAVAFEENGEVSFSTSNHFTGSKTTLKNLPGQKALTLAFPNKLKNMNKHPVRVIAHVQMPQVTIKGNTSTSKNQHFLDLIEEKFNATIAMNVFQEKTTTETYKKASNLINSRGFDLSLSTSYLFQDTNKLLPYEDNGFCALIPKKLSTTGFKNILSDPFDRASRVTFAVFLALCMVIWRLYNMLDGNSGSGWSLLYVAYAMFLGQSIRLDSRRFVLKCLKQMLFFGALLISYVYQGSRFMSYQIFIYFLLF